MPTTVAIVDEQQSEITFLNLPPYFYLLLFDRASTLPCNNSLARNTTTFIILEVRPKYLPV